MAKKAQKVDMQLEELNALRRQLSMVPLNKRPEGDMTERLAKLRSRVERDPVAQVEAQAEKPKTFKEKVAANLTGEKPMTKTEKKIAASKKAAEEKATEQSAASKKKVAAPEPEVETAPVLKASKAPVEAKGTNGDTVRLGDICKRLEIDARLARIKLRKAGDAVPPTVGESWRWASSDVAAVEAIINAQKGG